MKRPAFADVLDGLSAALFLIDDQRPSGPMSNAAGRGFSR